MTDPPKIAIVVQHVGYLAPAYGLALAKNEAAYIAAVNRRAHVRVDTSSYLGARIAVGLERRGMHVEGVAATPSDRRGANKWAHRGRMLMGVDELHLVELDPDRRGLTAWAETAKGLGIAVKLHRMWKE